MKSSFKTALVVFATFSPAALFATTDVADIMDMISKLLVDNVISFILALAFIYFLWGVLKYVNAGGEEKAAKEGRQMIINGLIALFVMIAVAGLVTILLKTFGLSYTEPQFTF